MSFQRWTGKWPGNQAREARRAYSGVAVTTLESTAFFSAA
jgi:hypothetical protein